MRALKANAILRVSKTASRQGLSHCNFRRRRRYRRGGRCGPKGCQRGKEISRPPQLAPRLPCNDPAGRRGAGTLAAASATARAIRRLPTAGQRGTPDPDQSQDRQRPQRDAKPVDRPIVGARAHRPQDYRSPVGSTRQSRVPWCAIRGPGGRCTPRGDIRQRTPRLPLSPNWTKLLAQ